MKANNIPSTFPNPNTTEKSQLSEESFEDFDSQEDVHMPLNDDDGSQSAQKFHYASSVGSLSEGDISELSLGEVNRSHSFPTGESDEESDADSRNLIPDWEDDAHSDVDSLSSDSNIQSKNDQMLRLSALLESNYEETENDDDENELLLQSAPQNANTLEHTFEERQQESTPPKVPLGVPDYIWQSPEALKKKSVEIGTSKSAKSKGKKKIVKEYKIDEESLSDGSLLDGGSVLSAPLDQVQTALFESDARTPEQLVSTPVKDSLPPNVIAIATPPHIGKKKLGKKEYLIEVSEEGDGTISRYNPMFYSSSKHEPLVDHSYRTKKEKLQSKKERKKVIREERERLQAFNKTMDFFAETGLEGDGKEEGNDTGNEALLTPASPPPAPNAESEADTTTEESSGSYDSLMFDDDFSIASMDSIEGVTRAKKSSRKKKGKKAAGKKKSGKKKKMEKKRGRRADFEPEDDADLEPERPRISIEERVEAIFTNKELIYQSHADVEKFNPEEGRVVKSRVKVKSKAARARSRSRSIDPKDNRGRLERPRSSGTLGSDIKRGMGKRSASTRSMKGTDYGDASPDVKLHRAESGGSNKSAGKGRPRPVRPKSGGKKTRSNSLSALTTNLKTLREAASLADFGGKGLGSDMIALSDHVPSKGHGKRSAREGLSKSDHGSKSDRKSGNLLSKSNHENGTGTRVMRGKRPDRLRPLSKSPNVIRDRRNSKSKSPSLMQRKKLDTTGRSVSRSPSAMQRKKLEAREESMRNFEQILGKRDHSKSPSNYKKKVEVRREKKPESSRTMSKSPKSKRDRLSPSSLRLKRQESGESYQSKDPDEDLTMAEEKPKSSRRSGKASEAEQEELKPESTRRKSKHPMERQETFEDEGQKPESNRIKSRPHMEPDEEIEEEELKPEDDGIRRRKVASDKERKRSRSRSTEFLHDMVEKVKPIKSNMVDMVEKVKPTIKSNIMVDLVKDFKLKASK
ncbi:MAG: hypothetical protein SGBAC_006201 [Bacillariaceae sp.]